MKEYVENMKEYVENMKKYDSEKFHAQASSWALGLENFQALPLGSGTWKNSEPHLI